MEAFSKNKLFRLAVQLFRQISGLRIPVYASHASFFIVLSLFPSLVLLLGLLRYTGLEVENLTRMLDGIIPAALMPAARRLILNAYHSTTSTVVSLSALTALWSAGRGIQGLMTGLNAVYGARENRGYFRTRGISILYTVLFLLILLLTLVLQVFGTTLLRLLPPASTPLGWFLTEVVDLRFFLLLILQTAVFTAMFMVLPNCPGNFRDSLPGAIFASAGWLIFSDLYSIYVERFTRYSVIYGSVYAVALSMLWLYCCISIVFYGGILNQKIK